MRRVALIATIAAAACAGALGAIYLIHAPGASPHQDESATFGIPPGANFCEPEWRSEVGYLVRLAPGTVAAMPAIKSPLLVTDSPDLSALGLDQLYVSDTDDRTSLPAGTQGVTSLDLLAADPDLHSCDYKLADKPAAVALRDAASQYLVARSLVSSAKLADPSTVWYVSDTDLPDGLVAVFTLLQTPAPAWGKPSSKVVMMTVFEGKNGPILGASEVNPYAAEPQSQ